MTSGKIKYFLLAAAAALIASIVWLETALESHTGSGGGVLIEKGDGLSVIAEKLERAGIVKSKLAFETLAALSGRARGLKPGLYEFEAGPNIYQIIKKLSEGISEVTVVIPEGTSLEDIDGILADAGVISRGALKGYGENQKINLEGFLFPDTYKFLPRTDVSVVIDKFLSAFRSKALPVLFPAGYNLLSPIRAVHEIRSSSKLYGNLILASLIEKEIKNYDDRRIAAGILKKRLLAGWPLQVDATICYLKPRKCYPLDPLDFKIDSAYNTYLHKGLPPAPINNPGLDAIKAVIDSKNSGYWFYLTDPKTGRTLFAQTLKEQAQNRERYLK